MWFAFASAIREIFENVSELLLFVYMAVEVKGMRVCVFVSVSVFVSDLIASQCACKFAL